MVSHHRFGAVLLDLVCKAERAWNGFILFQNKINEVKNNFTNSNMIRSISIVRTTHWMKYAVISLKTTKVPHQYTTGERWL